MRQLMVFSGEESQALEPVDLSRLISEMLQLLNVSISKRAVLKVNLSEQLPTVRANAAELRQVVLNLVTNASDALGEDEGVISVSVSRVRSGPDYRAPNLSHGDYVRLEVSDTGCGMTEEIQSRIFDPFFTSKFAGRGLGLAAVRGVIRSHGGTIQRGERAGPGFALRNSAAVQRRAGGRDWRDATAPAAGDEAANFAGTILVVEDEDTLRLAVSKMLRKNGFTVLEAADGETGIDLLRASTREIDVALLDLTLPGMSSREVLE